MIGNRNPTAGGAETAYKFAYCLSKAELVITSGLALGIDAASHRGALAATGKTVAVLGTGIEQIYPAKNKLLAQEILAHGLCLA
jgi:DNA processing protein